MEWLTYLDGCFPHCFRAAVSIGEVRGQTCLLQLIVLGESLYGSVGLSHAMNIL